MPPRRAPSFTSVAPSRAQSPAGDDEESPCFDTVDELQQHVRKQPGGPTDSVTVAYCFPKGINVQDILKLKSAAINTVFGGMSEAKVEKIKGSSFATGVEVQDKRKRVMSISTGSKLVDTILGGGIMSQSISEGTTQSHFDPYPVADDFTVYGEFRTGKTQLAHTMSVMAQLPPELGGASGKMELINECSARFSEDKDFRLLIVDSIMALFRVDYSGRGELSERQQKLAQVAAFYLWD
ncbi:hypothetical protein K443DRAFT_119639 [Laccaria amethystina LaAM-08-1]|uniref:Rad51-like C-terminal domain-containing protein n=1 Tax=Laccaria amethystina LaAM-08-1 TaxID=1095629 RepID=A0A0C9YBB0_9AGAR|nr:hypothetical protein K443DRAFT_119639 [Laccaria amethystina LaAM-08-1]